MVNIDKPRVARHECESRCLCLHSSLYVSLFLRFYMEENRLGKIIVEERRGKETTSTFFWNEVEGLRCKIVNYIRIVIESRIYIYICVCVFTYYTSRRARVYTSAFGTRIRILRRDERNPLSIWWQHFIYPFFYNNKFKNCLKIVLKYIYGAYNAPWKFNNNNKYIKVFFQAYLFKYPLNIIG